jgi:hypothetical protein
MRKLIKWILTRFSGGKKGNHVFNNLLLVKDKEAGNMIQIKHRSTGKVIKEVDATSLMDADLGGADLRGADLNRADLFCADLRGASLFCADLQAADLWGADLRGASLFCADLCGADLRCANLQDTNLQDADLCGADLRYAHLQRAKLQYTNLQDTNLQDTNFQDADLRWVLGDGKRIKTTIDRYRIIIMPEYGVMAIGCEQHSIAKWMNFSDKEINKMDTNALQWWKEWKPRIQQLIAG